MGEAEDLLRDAGMDNIIDFELDKVQGMLEPSSPQRYLRYLSSESPKLSDSGSFISAFPPPKHSPPQQPPRSGEFARLTASLFFETIQSTVSSSGSFETNRARSLSMQR